MIGNEILQKYSSGVLLEYSLYRHIWSTFFILPPVILLGVLRPHNTPRSSSAYPPPVKIHGVRRPHYTPGSSAGVVNPIVPGGTGLSYLGFLDLHHTITTTRTHTHLHDHLQRTIIYVIIKVQTCIDHNTRLNDGTRGRRSALAAHHHRRDP